MEKLSVRKFRDVTHTATPAVIRTMFLIRISVPYGTHRPGKGGPMSSADIDREDSPADMIWRDLSSQALSSLLADPRNSRRAAHSEKSHANTSPCSRLQRARQLRS